MIKKGFIYTSYQIVIHMSIRWFGIVIHRFIHRQILLIILLDILEVECCGGQWRMERFYRWRRNPKPPNLHISKPLQPLIPHMNHIVKPLYAWFGHYIASSMHCQAHLCQTFVSKISEFAQKIKKTFIKIYKGLINI